MEVVKGKEGKDRRRREGMVGRDCRGNGKGRETCEKGRERRRKGDILKCWEEGLGNWGWNSGEGIDDDVLAGMREGNY